MLTALFLNFIIALAMAITWGYFIDLKKSKKKSFVFRIAFVPLLTVSTSFLIIQIVKSVT